MGYKYTIEFGIGTKILYTVGTEYFLKALWILMTKNIKDACWITLTVR